MIQGYYPVKIRLLCGYPYARYGFQRKGAPKLCSSGAPSECNVYSYLRFNLLDLYDKVVCVSVNVVVVILVLEDNRDVGLDVLVVVVTDEGDGLFCRNTC